MSSARSFTLLISELRHQPCIPSQTERSFVRLNDRAARDAGTLREMSLCSHPWRCCQVSHCGPDPDSQRGTTSSGQRLPIIHRLLAFTLVLTGLFAFAAIVFAQRGGGGGTSGTSTTAPRITTPSAPAPSTSQSPAPQSATRAPMQRVPPVAPLSPSLQTPSTSLGASTLGSTGSGVRDSGTHMSKSEWRAARLRIQRRTSQRHELGPPETNWACRSASLTLAGLPLISASMA
jgi:hypothetical protein